MCTQPWRGSLEEQVPDTQLFGCSKERLTLMKEQPSRALLGFAASAQKGASPFHQKPSSQAPAAFLQWIHFLDAKHLYLLVLPFEQCLTCLF